MKIYLKIFIDRDAERVARFAKINNSKKDNDWIDRCR